MKKAFQNTTIYAEVDDSFTINLVEGGDHFWSRPLDDINENHSKLMILTFQYDEDWTTQEMHPISFPESLSSNTFLWEKTLK